jgi:glyoxylase-like metal-dependent hydrolase (beta-lactamase superfamily II)
MIRSFLAIFGAIVFLVASAHCVAFTMPVPQQVAPNVYALIGVSEEPSQENGGQVGNNGFIIGDDGVIVIDTGIRDAYGDYMLDVIRKITPKPVVLVINTHPDQAYIFGNGAFKRKRVPILAHRDADRLIAERCGTCLQNLQVILGSDLMQGTELVRPTQLVDGGMNLRIAGRTLEIIDFGQTHSPGAIAVLDHVSGVLFGGGLISIGRIPEVRDANVDNWIDALAQIGTMHVTQVVPGNGPISPPERIRETADYLKALSDRVKDSYRKGIGLGEAAAYSEVPAFRQWALYDVVHRRNVHYLYLEVERQDLK